MKKHLLTFSFVALFVFISSAAPARAQTPSQMRASIPFDFYVGGQRLAAGDYFIKSLNTQAGPMAIVLRSSDGKVGRMFITTLAGQRGPAGGDRPTLTFNSYGTDYFLAEIRSPSGAVAKLSKVKGEKSLARLTGGGRTVTVPAGHGRGASN